MRIGHNTDDRTILAAQANLSADGTSDAPERFGLTLGDDCGLEILVAVVEEASSDQTLAGGLEIAGAGPAEIDERSFEGGDPPESIRLKGGGGTKEPVTGPLPAKEIYAYLRGLCGG